MTDMQPYEAQDTRMTFGQTAMDATDFILPRVKIAQQMSAEVTRDESPATLGDFINTLTGENFGKAMRFIPLFPFKQRILLVRAERRAAIDAALGVPLSEGDGLKCRSLDMHKGVGEPGILCDECPLSHWTGNTPPLCSETYNVTAMTELGDLIVLSFSKSSAKVGKRVFSMLRLQHERPWTRIFAMHSIKTTNDRGTFAVPEVTITGERTPTELLSVAAEWLQQLEGRVLDVTPEDEDVEAGAAATGPAPF